MRSRCVSPIVLAGSLELPAPPTRLVADWERDIAQYLQLEPGDVEALSLSRARTRWPDYQTCVQAASDWTKNVWDLKNVLASSEVALMACRGARYHHDGEQYGGAAFCNLFLSEDKGLDLHFASTGHRIPLTRGTAVVFDTGQPHAVIRRGIHGFDPAAFPPDNDSSLVFLTWEFPVEHVDVARVLQITFDTDPANAAQLADEQVWLDGAPASVCPQSGQWLPIENGGP